ncbi:MAG: hypothetical protein HY939_07845 [Gammaproteobacteria bacterium]|nr:hypothetical protein [Gammaproteobacteria bacterium]
MLLNQPASVLALYQHSLQLWTVTLRKIYPLALACTFIPLLCSQYVSLQTDVALLNANRFDYNDITPFTLCLLLLNVIISMASYATLLTYTRSLIDTQPLSAWMLAKRIAIKTPLLVFSGFLAILSLFVGFILFILPGIYIFVVLFLFYPLVILEDNNPFKDFIHSFSLIKHHWWRTFFSLTLPIFLLTTFSLSCSKLLAYSLTPAHADTLRLSLRFLFQTLFMSVLFPWFCIQTLAVLHDLRLRRATAF